MRNAYTQVALTYLRRPLATWRGILLAGGWTVVAFAFTLAIVFVGHRGTSLAGVLAFMMPYFLLFLSLATHMKDQFADARAQLMPNFRRVHMAVAVAVFLVVGVFLPAAITLVAGFRSVGFAAIWVACFGTVLWCTVGNSLWAMWLPIMAMIVGTKDSAKTAMGGFCSGEHESLAVVILAVGAALCCHAMLRLVRLTEDDPKSYRRIEWDRNVNQAATTGPEVPDDGSLWQRCRAWAMDRAMDALTRQVRNAAVSRWSRIRRWQVNASPFPIALTMFFWTCLYVLLMPWFFSSAVFVKDGKSSPLDVMGFFLFLVPAFATLGHLTGRWPLIGREVLLPVERMDYLWQLGLGIAWNMFQSWAGVAAAMVFHLAIHSPEPALFGLLLRVLLFSGMVQVLAFGVAVWAATLRSRAGALTAMAVTLVAVLIVAATCYSPRGSDDYLIQAGVILAGIGLLFTWFGYCRWMTLDLA